MSAFLFLLPVSVEESGSYSLTAYWEVGGMLDSFQKEMPLIKVIPSSSTFPAM